MVSTDALVSSFQNLGLDVQDEAIINKCFQLCKTYGLNEDQLVETWAAYSLPRYQSLDPTLQLLQEMEEADLSGKPSLDIASLASDQDTMPSDVLSVYNLQPETPKSKRVRSPEPEVEREIGKIRAVDSAFAPSTYNERPNTPTRAPSAALKGKVLLHQGPLVDSWRKRDSLEIIVGKASSPHVPSNAVYMYEMLSRQGAILTSSCQRFGEHLCVLWNLGSSTETRYVRNVRCFSQTKFRTWGRINALDEKEKKNGTRMVVLEGATRPTGGAMSPMIRLDLTGLKSFSVFPGQVAAVEGINALGNVLTATDIFTKGYAPLPETPRLDKPLRIYVACGPFTPTDSLSYQPLWQLMESVKEDEPDLLILIGPFIEYTHPEIQSASIKDSFEELFAKLVTKLMDQAKGKSTQVVLVSSNRDAHHDPVFPTPQYTLFDNNLANETNLHVMPDPCILNIEGLHIGVTSVDSVKHLSHEEISNTPGMDRLSRLASHVLSQATFYPLYPAASKLNLDTSLWRRYACFEEQPHIMILPSDIRYYCKTINDCTVVNPERLHKHLYAKLLVPPVRKGKWDSGSITCEIVKA